MSKKIFDFLRAVLHSSRYKCHRCKKLTNLYCLFIIFNDLPIEAFMKDLKRNLIWLWIIWPSLVIWEPIFSKNQEKTKEDIQKELSTDNQKNITHDSIIRMSFENISKFYGKEKWLEIIRMHTLIEINKIRQSNDLQTLTQNDKLTKCAQDYAEYMDKNNRFNHKDKSGDNHTSRIKKTWYPFEKKWEVIAKWILTIEEFISTCLGSQEHLNEINWIYFFDVGIWYYSWYRVIDLGGNK